MMFERKIFDDINQIYDYLEENYGREWYVDYLADIKKLKNGKYEVRIYKTSDFHLEDKLDIDPEELEQILSYEITQGSEKVETEEYMEPLIFVNVSEDEMLASITIIPGLKKELPAKEEVIEILKENGVVMGIDEKVIEEALEEKKIFSSIIVAKGKKPEPSMDAKLDVKFQSGSHLKTQPECEEFKKIIKCCDKLVVLAEKIPPIEGKDGYTVTGKILKARKPKDLNLYDYLGENVELSEDGTKIISKIAGEPYIDRWGKISVRNVLFVEGDLKEVGNIDFPGTVVIEGNAEGLYEIKTKGDLVIRGVVGGVTIKSEGNIVIEKGIFGRSKGGIECGKDFRASYINNSTVKCAGNIFVDDYIMDSIVLAKGSIVVNGRGIIVGGKIFAGENISCNTIGSSFGTITRVGCGIDYERTLKLVELENELESIIMKLSTAIKLILKFEKIVSSLSNQENRKYIIILRKLNERKMDLQKKIKTLRDKIRSLNKEIMIENLKIRNRILVFKNCREAVVQIGGHILKVIKETGPGFFELDHIKNEIVFRGKNM